MKPYSRYPPDGPHARRWLSWCAVKAEDLMVWIERIIGVR